MTKLETKLIHETSKVVSGRDVIVTIAPAGSQAEALIGLRRKGTRTQYVLALSDVYRWAAQTYAMKELAARRSARKQGVTWRVAKREFVKSNCIP